MPSGVGSGNPHQYSCLGTYGQRSLAGYSPWGRKESDVTEHSIHIKNSNIFVITLLISSVSSIKD